MPVQATPVQDLHLLLVPRIHALRAYVAGQIHPRFKPLISADDILQEVWMTVYRAGGSLRAREPAAIDAWLRTIARSRLLDALRIARQSRHGGKLCRYPQLNGSLKTCSDLFTRLRARCRTPSQDLHVVETGHLVSMVLNLLTEDRRRAIRLRYFDGLSLEEVSRAMEKSPQAINSLLFHGLRQLRELLGSAASYFSDARSSDQSALSAGPAPHSGAVLGDAATPGARAHA